VVNSGRPEADGSTGTVPPRGTFGGSRSGPPPSERDHGLLACHLGGRTTRQFSRHGAARLLPRHAGPRWTGRIAGPTALTGVAASGRLGRRGSLLGQTGRQQGGPCVTLPVSEGPLLTRAAAVSQTLGCDVGDP